MTPLRNKRKPNRNKHRLSKKATIVLISGVGLIVLVGIIVYSLLPAINGVTPVEGCNPAGHNGELATRAANRFADEINDLGVPDQPYQTAEPAVDTCVDGADTAYAIETKNYSGTGVALMSLHYTVQSRLETQGFTQKHPLALSEVPYDPGQPVYVDETYSKRGSQDLLVRYTVGTNQKECHPPPPNQSVSDCISQIQASFSNLQALKVSSVILSITQDLP